MDLSSKCCLQKVPSGAHSSGVAFSTDGGVRIKGFIRKKVARMIERIILGQDVRSSLS